MPFWPVRRTVIVDGKIVDFTKYAKYHPGGATVLEAFDGQDASTEFHRFHSHSDKAQQQMQRMIVSNVSWGMAAVMAVATISIGLIAAGMGKI
mmetsp:Transcript_136290/g.192735  ORF Transcript_136290/g.192735 Transcript_136290/m.192735 type:complete len:93 (-) Transcript_136290:291-569(-)